MEAECRSAHDRLIASVPSRDGQMGLFGNVLFVKGQFKNDDFDSNCPVVFAV